MYSNILVPVLFDDDARIQQALDVEIILPLTTKAQLATCLRGMAAAPTHQGIQAAKLHAQLARQMAAFE